MTPPLRVHVPWRLRPLLARRPWRARPRVLDVTRGAVHVEQEGDDPGQRAKVAVLAHWAASPRLSRSAEALIDAMHGAGFRVVLVSAAPPGALVSPGAGTLAGVTVLRRPNLGYDFGSWATALDHFPDLVRAEHVLLMNDSLLGPFADVGHLLHAFDRTAADVWGLTDSSQRGYHLQSYALGFRGGLLADPPLRAFWGDVRIEPNKYEVIRRCELGLGRLLRHRGYRVEAAFPYGDVGTTGHNPSIIGWRRLLDLGFPFVKRELVTSPEVAPDAAHVPAEIRSRFGAEVADWL